ncbi:MAG: WD40 repeat domain-containing protein [Armatimonadetes bacterium]|nr:MAG: WD40 repeat domain-containing protein [Armatimonadota bacterium]
MKSLTIPTLFSFALVASSAAAYKVVPSGKLLGEEALSVAFAPSGSQFVCGMADNSVKIFDAKTRQTLKVFKGHNLPVRAVAWSPKGDKIASGAENAQIRVWNVKTGESVVMQQPGHIRSISHLAFDPTGKKLVSTGDDDTIRVWDIASRKSILLIKGGGINVYNARFDSTGQRIVAASLGKGLIVYNAKTGAAVFALNHSPGANDVDVNSGFTRGISAGRDGNLAFWDLKNRKRITFLRGHTDWVVSAAISPNGALAASSSSDGTVIVWDLKTLQPVAKLEGQSYTGSPLAWSASSGFLVTVAADNYLRIYTVTK